MQNVKEPSLSICVSLKNRSYVTHGDTYLSLFPNCVKSISKAAGDWGRDVELVISDFNSDDIALKDWIYQLSVGIHVNVVSIDQSFSRGCGLNLAVNASRSSRLLITDADILIDQSVLIRATEVIDQGKVWWPIFSCLDEEGRHVFWQDLSHGVAAMDRTVFDAAGGIPEFQSWGGEDDIFNEKVSSYLPGIRERWGGLKHQWHPEACRHEYYDRPRKSDYEKYRSSFTFLETEKRSTMMKEQRLNVLEKLQTCKRCPRLIKLDNDHVSCLNSKTSISLTTGKCPLHKWPLPVRTESKSKLRIFQVYFDQFSRSNLEPELYPYYNIDCTKFFENSVIRKLIESGEHIDQDYFGVFSHKFRLKLNNWTHSRAYKCYGELEKYVLNSAADVVSVLNTNDNHDPIDVGDWWHPNFSRILKMVLKKIGFDYERKPLKHSLYCNCFVATPQFWNSYCNELLFPVMDVMENAQGELRHRLNSDSNYAPLPEKLKDRFGLLHYPYHPFICERLPNIFLMKYPHYKVVAW